MNKHRLFSPATTSKQVISIAVPPTDNLLHRDSGPDYSDGSGTIIRESQIQVAVNFSPTTEVVHGVNCPIQVIAAVFEVLELLGTAKKIFNQGEVLIRRDVRKSPKTTLSDFKAKNSVVVCTKHKRENVKNTALFIIHRPPRNYDINSSNRSDWFEPCLSMHARLMPHENYRRF